MEKDLPQLSQEEIAEQKAEIEALVNAGKLSRESALAIAEKFGLIAAPVIDPSVGLAKSTQLFNFSVYKWSKGRTVQRLILQFDFQSQTLSSIQHGTRTKKVLFTDITSYQSEDGLRLTIQFASQNEYELDADTQEDKNKMCRLLAAVMRSVPAPSLDEEALERSLSIAMPASESTQSFTAEQSQARVAEDGGLSNGHITESQVERALTSDSLTSAIYSSPPIKEDMVEKKGHSVKALLWAKRWLKVCEGELMYYKPDDIENALNIIPLTPNVTELKKVGNNQFTVTLNTSNRVFSFKALSGSGKSPQQNRDDWFEAIQQGCFKRRDSAAGLRRGTVTAKEMMPKNPASPFTGIVRRITLRRASSPQDSEALENSPPDGVELRHQAASGSPVQQRRIERRAKTYSGTGFKKSRLSFRNNQPSSESEREESATPVPPPRTKRKNRTTSTFYDNEDTITRKVTEPREFPELNLRDKDGRDLMLMLRPQFNELVPIIQNFTIGSSEVDQMLIRIDSIICALEAEYTQRTGTPLRERTVTSPDSEGTIENRENKHLSAVLENGVPSNSSSRHASPAAASSREGSVDPAQREASSPDPEGPQSPTENSEGGADHRARSTTGSRSSLRKSMINELANLTEDELKEALADPELVNGVVRAPSQSGSNKATPVSSPVGPSSPEPSTAPDQTNPSIPAPPPLPGSNIPMAPPLPGVAGVPPPPPFLGGVPPPPAIGGFQLQASILPPKKIPTPSCKLRKIHWNALKPQTVMDSGWMQWSKNDKMDSIDIKDLEKLFGVTETSSKPTPAPRVEMKTLLDTTRSRNIEIFLPTFPFQLGQLADKLNQQLNMVTEESDLGLDHIIALKRYQPTEEEREMYKKHTGDKNNLQNGDIFLVKLCEVPLLSTRLDLLFSIREFPSNLEGFQPTLELAWKATNELKNSRQFEDLLCYVLAVGNYLNAGSRQGGAYGFKLDILPKLVESYGQSKKVSLLHFIIQQVHNKQPELLNWTDKMESVAKSSEISISSILAEIDVMQRELDKIERYAKKIVEQAKIDKASADKLLADVKEFVKHYRVLFIELDKMGQEMNQNYKELLKKFGEPATTDSEDFFSQISKFISQFKRVHLELFPPPPSPKPEKKERTRLNKLASVDENEKGSALPSFTVTDGGSSPSDRKRPKSVAQLGLPGADSSNNKFVSKARARTIPKNQLKPKLGNLEKLTKDGKRWNKRYFELESCNLHYYESKGQKYSDTIKMYNVPVRQSSDDKRVIILETDKRVWHLRAESESLADEWVGALLLHSGAGR